MRRSSVWERGNHLQLSPIPRYGAWKTITAMKSANVQLFKTVYFKWKKQTEKRSGMCAHLLSHFAIFSIRYILISALPTLFEKSLQRSVCYQF